MNLNTIESHYTVNTLCVTSFCDSDTKNNSEAIRKEGKEKATIFKKEKPVRFILPQQVFVLGEAVKNYIGLNLKMLGIETFMDANKIIK